MITTVNIFMTWYNGKSWNTDYQTSNSMSVNGVNAQKDKKNGLSHLSFLFKNKDEKISLIMSTLGHIKIYSFVLEGNVYSIDAILEFKP